MSYKYGNTSIVRMIGVNPVLIRCAEIALSKSQHDMTIPNFGGLRTPEDQNSLFQKGYSKADGYEKKSYHQTGDALDVIPVIGGYKNEKAFRHFAGNMFSAWQMMIKANENEGYILEWGGHWQNFIDVPHWQIVKR
ncbi:MAG: M15 family metallopeptidase [Bacteroidetes bacterium]|nr:M15 family metallopeptidase [Bacteroidota bacterium]